MVLLAYYRQNTLPGKRKIREKVEILRQLSCHLNLLELFLIF